MYPANRQIKLKIKGLGFTQAQVAKEIGISYSYFTKLLQIPLNPQWRARTEQAINRLLVNRKKQQQRVLEWVENPESGYFDEQYYKEQEHNADE